MRGLSLVAASGGHSSSLCVGLSLSRHLLLRSTSSRHAGSVVVAHVPICSTACGIFPDQGSNLCPLHWQAGSQPLRHQGSPPLCFFLTFILFLHLYWSIIALQWCVSFCFITKLISYTYTYVSISLPSCISLPPTLPIPPL